MDPIDDMLYMIVNLYLLVCLLKVQHSCTGRPFGLDLQTEKIR